jgi:hypothetical protein
MKNPILYPAFAALLLAGTSGAHAQTVIAQDGVVTPLPPAAVVTQPIVAAPIETVETVRTVQSTVPLRRHTAIHHWHARPRAVTRVTTTRTVVRRVVPEVATVAPPPEVVAMPAVAASPYSTPVYDMVPGPAVVPPPLATPAVAPLAAPVPMYRYVYEPDRILVIDVSTGVAVQALPR